MIVPGDTIVERLEYLIERAKYYGELTEALPVFEELHYKLTIGALHSRDNRDQILYDQHRKDVASARARETEPV